MDKKIIRIAGAQKSFPVGAIQKNKQTILDCFEAAEEKEVDILIFPELALTGYPPEDLLLRESFVGKNFAVLEELAEFSSSTSGVVGFVDRNLDDNHTDKRKRDIANAAAIIQNGDVKGIYHKCFLPNYSVFDEARYFAKGNNPGNVFWYEDIGIGISICEDIWIEEGPSLQQVENGASLIININASPYDQNKSDLRKELVVNQARKLGVPIIYLNMVGGQDELVFDGGSFVVDGKGEILYQAQQFEEELFYIDLDLEVKEQPRGSLLEIRQKRSELDPLQSALLLSKNESLYSALKLGLFDYVSKNNFEKVLIGLSGGIDSALTATIAVDALGSDNVIGVALPSKYNTEESLIDAKLLAENLDIEFKVIEIEEIVNIFRNTLKESVGEELGQTTDENIQSRVRGNILMALSNQTGAMVVSTGNKSEMAVGYSTLYGDLAGGFALLKDLYKTEVYNLANFRNSISSVIPQNTIDKEPSAELRPDQFDKDSLPEYDLLDEILRMYIEEDSSSEKIISKGIDENVVFDVLSKVDRNEYKRKQVAPGVKLTEKAFGKDRRMPITNTYVRERG
ncbi:MAG: NAD+ synthase [Candidatus Actinomarina sp.]|nr:NAD+ synthase [Candidatus Actinomarina sp.]MBL6762491.1 NAD+ synthase [Candidatus Actinomarina sp.]MBL6835782.1 NAD+ synthase [Candidatus Actinomarina sp.]